MILHRRKLLKVLCKQACPVGVRTPFKLWDSTPQSATRGRSRATRHSWSLSIHSNLYLQISQSIHISKIVPKFRSLQDTGKQAKRLANAKLNYIMLWVQILEILYVEKGCCLYITLMFQKLWLKFLEAFWSENTHTVTYIQNPYYKMWT